MCENSRQRVIHISSAVAVIFLESQVAGVNGQCRTVEVAGVRHQFGVGRATVAELGEATVAQAHEFDVVGEPGRIGVAPPRAGGGEGGARTIGGFVAKPRFNPDDDIQQGLGRGEPPVAAAGAARQGGELRGLRRVRQPRRRTGIALRRPHGDP